MRTKPASPKENGTQEVYSPTFKKFTSEHKAKMKMLYPFLTDTQIMGRLKKQWKSQGTTPSKSPSHRQAKKKEVTKFKRTQLDLEMFSFQDDKSNAFRMNSPSRDQKIDFDELDPTDGSGKKQMGIMKSCSSGTRTSGHNVSFQSPAERFLYSQPESSQGAGASSEDPSASEIRDEHFTSSSADVNNNLYTMDDNDYACSDYDDDDDDDAVLIKRTDSSDDGKQESMEPDCEETTKRARKRLASEDVNGEADLEHDCEETTKRGRKRLASVDVNREAVLEHDCEETTKRGRKRLASVDVNREAVLEHDCEETTKRGRKRIASVDVNREAVLEHDCEETTKRGRKRIASVQVDVNGEVNSDRDARDTIKRKPKKVKLDGTQAEPVARSEACTRKKSKKNKQAHFDISRDFNFSDSVTDEDAVDSSQNGLNEFHRQELKHDDEKENEFDEDDTDFQTSVPRKAKKGMKHEAAVKLNTSHGKSKKLDKTPAPYDERKFGYTSPLFEELKTELAKIEAGKAPKKRRSADVPEKLTTTGKRVTRSLSSGEDVSKHRVKQDLTMDVNAEDSVDVKPKTVVSEKVSGKKPGKTAKAGRSGTDHKEDSELARTVCVVNKKTSINMNPSGDASQAGDTSEIEDEPQKAAEDIKCDLNNNLSDGTYNKMKLSSKKVRKNKQPMAEDACQPGGQGACFMATSPMDAESLPPPSESTSQSSEDYHQCSQLSSQCMDENVNPALRRALSGLRSFKMSSSPGVMSPSLSSTSSRSSLRLLSPALSGVSEFSSASSSSQDGSIVDSNMVTACGQQAVTKMKPGEDQDLCGMFADVTPPDKKTRGAYKTNRILTSNTKQFGTNVKALFHTEDADLLFN